MRHIPERTRFPKRNLSRAFRSRCRRTDNQSQIVLRSAVCRLFIVTTTIRSSIHAAGPERPAASATPRRLGFNGERLGGARAFTPSSSPCPQWVACQGSVVTTIFGRAGCGCSDFHSVWTPRHHVRPAAPVRDFWSGCQETGLQFRNSLLTAVTAAHAVRGLIRSLSNTKRQHHTTRSWVCAITPLLGVPVGCRLVCRLLAGRVECPAQR